MKTKRSLFIILLTLRVLLTHSVGMSAAAAVNSNNYQSSLSNTFHDIYASPTDDLFVDSGQALGDTSSHMVALGDVDGDNDLDAFVAKSGSNELWLNTGDGTFTNSGQFMGTATSFGVVLGDLDHDDDLDAFVANRGFWGGAPDRVWLNDGTGNYGATTQLLGDLSSYDVALGDVDQDGDLDAFSAACGDALNPPVNANTLWFNDGSGSFSDSGLDFGTLCSSVVEIADVNGDDDLDIIVGNSGSDHGVEVWINELSGAGHFTKHQVIDLTYNFDVALGDLNNDSHLDIFIANGDALGGVQPNHVWLNDGTGVFLDTLQTLGSAASRGVALGDFDLDGDLDAFVANGSSAQVLPDKVWINDGTGQFSDSGQTFDAIYSLEVAVGDLDGNTTIDVFIATDQADRVLINLTNRICIVTNTTDAGPGSLRQAIVEANAHVGADVIEFDIPVATDPGCNAVTGVCTIQPASALPILTDDATTIDGYSQDGAAPAVGGTPATILIQIDGSGVANDNGFNISSDGNVIQGLAVNRFPWNGIAIGGSEATGNIISGNHIGTDPSGSVDLGNGLDGVFVGLGAQNNLIGGDEPAERNVISGNEWEGVGIHGGETMSNTVSGNYIGAAADGVTALGNTLYGVRIYGGAQDNVIGGDTVGERNVVSGNSEDGVRIAGVGTTGNIVSGNYIGTDTGGTTALGNDENGVYIADGAQDNTIGGDTGAEGNIISGNSRDGIYIAGDTTSGNVISHNTIGTDASGTVDLGNGQDGIELDFGAHGNIIGPGNMVAYNDSSGVYVDDETTLGNTITQNSIFANTGLGIELLEGAHGGITAPEITETAFGGGNITVTGTACAGCTVEVFDNSTDDGEGEFHLGSAAADGSGAFSLSLTSLPYPYLTATATDAADGTSEFSEVFTSTVQTLYLPLVLR